MPLTAVTREVLKPERTDPWGQLHAWTTTERPEPWQVWRSWREEAERTLRAPCQEACPAGTGAGRYIGLLAEGRYEEAFAVAAEVNPFASVCGYICTAPCEAVCRRGVLDEPVAIRTLKRAAAEHGTLPPLPPPAVRRRERIAWWAAVRPASRPPTSFLARLGYRITVFEAMPVLGGMMAIGIPEYRLPKRVLREELERIVATASRSAWAWRWVGTSRCSTSSGRGSPRSSWPPAPRRAAASGCPARTWPGSCRPRSSCATSTWGRCRGWPGRRS